MFKLSENNTVVEISSKAISPSREDAKLLRPEVVDAKVYKLKVHL